MFPLAAVRPKGIRSPGGGWQRIGQIGAALTVTSGNWTGSEHASTLPGDLLVCGLCYRSTPAFTLPAGWGLCATQRSGGNTTVNTTGSIASCVMAYIVRGASAPDFVFTRTGGDVAHGFVATYRGNTPTPFDTGSSAEMAVQGQIVSTTTITTAENNELLVAFCFGARSIGIPEAYDAATGATTGSTGQDNTTAPTSNTWFARAVSGTTSGADCGISYGDAIMTTAGATGTVQCDVGSGSAARHCMAVAAFKKAA